MAAFVSIVGNRPQLFNHVCFGRLCLSRTRGGVVLPCAAENDKIMFSCKTESPPGCLDAMSTLNSRDLNCNSYDLNRVSCNKR